MPIIIPNALPAAQVLQNENIFVMHEQRAGKQDIRPLQVAILNLMPTKIETETQLARLLGNTPLQVKLTLLHTATHEPTHTAKEHLISFYETFEHIKEQKFDGFIITGAPVEHMDFEDVSYWKELCAVMEWTKTHVYSTLHICWGAQAGLYYHYGVGKQPLEKKLSGVFPHTVDYKNAILLRGFDDVFWAPHSRHTTVSRADIEAASALQILASSKEAGVYAVKTDRGKQIFITGHPEYDTHTLEKEYRRDKNAGLDAAVPENYYPGGDDTQPPVNTWRSGANLLFFNWLNYIVYQTTPYELEAIGTDRETAWMSKDTHGGTDATYQA